MERQWPIVVTVPYLPDHRIDERDIFGCVGIKLFDKAINKKSVFNSANSHGANMASDEFSIEEIGLFGLLGELDAFNGEVSRFVACKTEMRPSSDNGGTSARFRVVGAACATHGDRFVELDGTERATRQSDDVAVIGIYESIGQSIRPIISRDVVAMLQRGRLGGGLCENQC